MEQPSPEPNTPVKKQNSPTKLFLDLFICLLIPTLILKKLSGDDTLGTTWAFVLALSLPLSMAIFEIIKERKVGLVSALGFISILLTGGIGLLKLPKEYIAYKEALIPAVLACIAIISAFTRKPLIRVFLYNDMVMDTHKVQQVLVQRGNVRRFDQAMSKATLILASSFVLSSILNFILAKWIIVSNTGTQAFNDELGTMNLLSWPVIVLPCMVVTLYTFFYVVKNIRRLTGLKLEEIAQQ